MSSNTPEKQLSKRLISTSSNVTFYAGHPPRDHNNVKRELTTSFKDSYKSLGQPKPESKTQLKSQDFEAAVDSSSKDESKTTRSSDDEDKRESSAISEAGMWAAKVFNHSMATRGLH